MTEEFLTKAKQIYTKLEDEESKKIFLYKLNWAITENIEPLLKYMLLKDYHEFFNQVHKLAEEGNEIIIYGAGANCVKVLDICQDIPISYICDRSLEKQNTGYRGFQVISLEELIKNHRNAAVIVSTTKYCDEVVKNLEEVFFKEKIVLFSCSYEQERLERQYFEKDILSFSDNEVFVDGGCYDFETSKSLMEKCRVKKIYAFEPDYDNIEKIERQITKYADCEVVLLKKGLWNQTDTLTFSATGDMESYVIEKNDLTDYGNNYTQIEVVAMDEVIKEPVTLIKMDIEGSELRALEGAKQLIQTYRPKLAISIYHKPEDTVDIPAYISELVPDYKFYIRHYSYGPCETVLYAV